MLGPKGGAAVNGGPFNIITGAITAITPPQFSGQQAYAFVILYNETPFILQVTGVGGSYFLQPLQADVYSMPGGTGFANSPTVIPVSNQLGGIFAGQVSATFIPVGVAPLSYLDDLEPPPGFPLPLQPFPGGLFTAASFSPGFDIGPVFKGNVLQFAAPGGTGLVQLTFLGTAGLVPPISNFVYTLTGLQSGTVYTVTPNSGAPPTAPFGPVTVNIPVNPSFGDTIFTLAQTWTGAGTYSGVKLTAINASGAGGAPTYPTNVANATGTTASLIAAPASGALYLFEADVVIAGTTSDTGSFTFNGSTIAVGGSGGFGAPASVPFVDHVDFKAFRCPGSGGAVGFASGVGTTRTTIRYAFGP